MKTPLPHLADAIVGTFRELGVEGFANLSSSREKSFSYTPLGEEESVKERVGFAISVAMLKDGRKAVLSLDSEDPAEIRARMLEAFRALPFVTPDEDVRAPETSDRADEDDRRFDFDAVKSSDLVERFRKIREFPFPEGMQIEGFSVSVDENERVYANSAGARKRHVRSSSGWGVELFLPTQSGGDVWYDGSTSPEFPEIADAEISAVAERLVAMSSPIPATFESGTHRVALEADVFEEFLGFLCGSVSAEAVRQKASFLEASEFGSRILPEGFSLRSVARVPETCAGRLFDGEGTTTEDLDVVKDGVWTNYFADLKNARKFGIRATGNPGPANLVFEAPEKPEALKSAKFLFTNLMAFHTVDSISGKFALEGEGFELRDGERVGYVKNVALSGNVRDLFSNLVAESGNRKWRDGLLCGDVVVGGLNVNV